MSRIGAALLGLVAALAMAGPADAEALRNIDTGRGFFLAIPASFQARCSGVWLLPDARVAAVCTMGRPGNEIADGAALFCTASPTGVVDPAFVEEVYAAQLQLRPRSEDWPNIQVAADAGRAAVPGMAWPTTRRELHLTAGAAGEHGTYAVILVAVTGSCALERHLNTAEPLSPARVAALEAEFRAMLRPIIGPLSAAWSNGTPLPP